MASYVDFSYYSETYLGIAIVAADFARLSLRASEQIDRLTFGRAADDEDNEDAIKNATCAVAEIIQSVESGASGIKSERVGDFSVNYVDGAGKSASAKVQYRDAAAHYLASTGLMFAGFIDGEYSGTYAD